MTDSIEKTSSALETEQIDPILQEEDRKEQNKRGFEGRKKPQIDVDDLTSKIVDKLQGTVTGILSKDIIEDELEKYDLEDRESIRKEYETSINKTGYTRKDIQNDLKKASLLANPEKLQRQASEKQAAEVAQATTGRSASSGATAYQGGTASANKFDYKKILTQPELEWGKSRGWSEERFELAAKRKAGLAPDNRPK